MWSGSWTIQTIPDGPSYVTINISLVGGKNYSATDGPMYLCETYPLLISPSGTELLIGARARAAFACRSCRKAHWHVY